MEINQNQNWSHLLKGILSIYLHGGNAVKKGNIWTVLSNMYIVVML